MISIGAFSAATYTTKVVEFLSNITLINLYLLINSTCVAVGIAFAVVNVL